MEFDDIANLINRAALEQKGRLLKDVERVVLKGAWENQTYSTMATLAVGYTEDYLKKDVGPKLWRLLSDLVDPQGQGIKVTKRNIQNVLQTWASQPGLVPESTHPPGLYLPGLGGSPPPATMEVQGFPDIDLSDFCGRSADLATLNQWIQRDRCRSIVLWGLPGVGKSTLAAKVAVGLRAEFEAFGYLTLPKQVTDEPVLTTLAQWLSPADYPLSPTVDWVLEQLELHRYLLIIDDMEQLFEPGQLTGTYRPGTDGMQRLFELAANRRHSSCLVWISGEKPVDLSQLLGGRVREYHLNDLVPVEVQPFFQRIGRFNAAAADWLALTARYGSSPLLLKGLADTIQTVYQQQVKPFLSAAPLIIPVALCQSLDQTIVRLSSEELALLYWLAVAHQPVAVSDLETAMLDYPGTTALQSLLGRSLCQFSSEPGAATPTLDLQPVVRVLVNTQLVSVLAAELVSGSLDWFNRLPLITMTAWEVIQSQQREAMLHSLGEELRHHYPTEALLTAQWQQLHQALRQICLGRPGYGAGNFIHLSQYLGISLSEVDFSTLAIWQADLRQVSLQGANFSQAQLQDTVLATALGRRPVATFSPDGRYLVTADQDGRLLLWELDQGTLVRVLEDPVSQSIQALAFSPDGNLLAVGTDTGQIWLWPVQATQQVDGLFNHQAPVRCLVFSADGTRLASGDETGHIVLWDLASGLCQGQLDRHQGSIHSLAFNSEGDRLVSGGDDQRACLWHVPQRTLISCFQARPAAWVRTAGFLTDPGQPAAPPVPFAAGYDEHCLTIWDLEAGRPCWILPADVQTIPAMAISPSGRYLICSRQDFTVTVWDIPSRTACYTLPALDSPVWLVAVSADNRYFVTGSDYTLKLWSTPTGDGVRSWLSQSHPVRGVAFAADSRRVITGHDDGHLRLWQISAVSPFASGPRTLAKYSSPLLTLAVSTDGQWLASSADDQTIGLWQNATGDCAYVLAPTHGPAALLDFSPDCRWLASAGEDPAIALWDVATGVCVEQLVGHDGPPSVLTFSPDSKWLISGSRDCTIRVWNLDRLTPARVWTGHQGQVHGLALSPDGTLVASASHDGTIRWWTWVQDNALGCWYHPDGAWLHGVTIDPAGDILAITSQAAQLEIWAVATNQRCHRLIGHTHDIWQAGFSPDRTAVATASQDDEIRIWELHQGRCLQVLRPNRPYAGVNIHGVTGLSEPEDTLLKTLGAVVKLIPNSD
ncbi:MAG: NB-ARC domain-containing protein [Nodosilinea sp.]